MTPEVSRITIYPVKSLDGIDMPRAVISSGGALENDRRFAMRDESGKYINGKKNPRVHKLKPRFSEGLKEVRFSVDGMGEGPEFELNVNNTSLTKWLSEYFSMKVSLVENSGSGFPDDTEAYGPTIASSASYEMIAGWFENMTSAEVHKRFRANIVLNNCIPFWEDNLFSESGIEKQFQIGNILFYGVNPCNRCIVPTRNPDTGESASEFQRIFIEKRKEHFPPEIDAGRFDHYYKFTVNTRIPFSEAGKVIAAGDKVLLNSY